MIILFGYTTRSTTEAPVVIYCGSSGVDALKAAEASTFPRIERVDHPQTYPVRGWTAERAAAHAEAVAKAGGEDLLEAESQKFLQGRVESQRADIDQLRKQLGDVEQAKIRAELELVSLRSQVADLQAKGRAVMPMPEETISEPIPAASESGAAADAAGPTLSVADDGGPALLADVADAPAPRSRRK